MAARRASRRAGRMAPVRSVRRAPLAAMGIGMARPVTKKDVSHGKGVGGRLAFGQAAMQGWRDTMEDSHLAMPNFDPARGLGLFGVFDGHGGSAVSAIIAERFEKSLKQLPAYKAGDYGKALSELYLGFDEFFASAGGRKEVSRRNPGAGPRDMGSTAVVALIEEKPERRLLVANAGDSRCVLISNRSAIEMSQDHSPTLPSERRRVIQAGGSVNKEGRINGNLNVSRAIGDLFYKANRRLRPEQQLISAQPDIRTRKLGADDRYLLLGCDGIWERASSQGIADAMLKLLGPKDCGPKVLAQACSVFLDCNVSKNPIQTEGLGCDNMTMVLVDLQSGDPPSLQRQPLPRPPSDPPAPARQGVSSTQGLQEPSAVIVTTGRNHPHAQRLLRLVRAPRRRALLVRLARTK